MKTDWDDYYRRPFPAARWTRRRTENLLVRLIRQFAGGPLGTIAEVGGGNSCFFARLNREFTPQTYTAIDNNPLSLELLARRCGGDSALRCQAGDVLALEPGLEADLVFSVGLIEHFSPEDTARAVANHFHLARPGGLVLLSFPTPTWLYRLCRFAAECVGAWKFPDERPLLPGEVLETVRRHGEVLAQTINWPIVLTQCVVVARKQETRDPLSS